jgi:hypothetical protein
MVGREPVSERDLFVADLPSPGDVASFLDLPSPHFVCLLAWDSTGHGDGEILDLMRALVRAGCVYLCSWGRGCERVHDLFDQADLERTPDGPFAMSTWHADEALAEAIWFALFNAFPDDAFFDQCRSTLGITIGASKWGAEVRRAFEEKCRPGPTSS